METMENYLLFTPPEKPSKSLIFLVGAEGFEPSTL